MPARVSAYRADRCEPVLKVKYTPASSLHTQQWQMNMQVRQSAKRILKLVFLGLALPLVALYRLFCLIDPSETTFQAFSQLLSLVPGKTGVFLRAACYSLVFTDTSDETSIGFMTIFSHADTTLGRGVYIGAQCNIGKCTIGDGTLLGSGVHILSGSRQHDFSDIDVPIQEQGGVFEKISIGKDCWLGNTCVVMAELGDQSIVAAGSVVTKPVAVADIVAGNPARAVRSRLPN